MKRKQEVKQSKMAELNKSTFNRRVPQQIKEERH